MKITYIISNINKALEFEWAAIQLTQRGYELNFILLNNGVSELETFLKSHNIKCTTILFKNKYSLLFAIYKLVNLLKVHSPDIVHCHLFEATIAGLIAAKIAGIKKRIHTRHHSTWHHRYHKNAIKYDKLNNFLSTKIIAISSVVKDVLLKEGVSEKKIEIVFHGIDLPLFTKVDTHRVESLKLKYNINTEYPVIGVISRYTIWKGIHYIIPAFKNLLLKYPEAVLVLANARGEYQDQIKKSLREIPSHNYREIVFENDLFALYKLFSIFVHVPLDSHSEAFGQVYIESMAAGIPMICTRSGIGCEILIHESNAFIVPYSNSNAIYEGMIKILKDKAFSKNLVLNAHETVKLYSLDKKINRLDEVYTKLIKNE